jgi:lipoprotein-releasing system ATP-binding protein
MPELQVQHVGKEYPTRSAPLIVLRDVSLELSAGEHLAVLGPSGCGKSTLLQILGTLEPPTSGDVTIRGENPFELSEPELARFRRRNIGFVFQEHHLLPQLSVLENVVVPALAEGAPTRDIVDRAHELIDRVGLSAREDHRPAELSGGERQRVAVARALLLRPVLLLADEPTGSLDRTNALVIGRLLLELQEQEQSMLIAVTHSHELAELFHRRVELDDGRLVERNLSP